MHATIEIDAELLAKATRLADDMDPTAIVRESLKAFIERESARRIDRRTHRWEQQK